MRRFSSGGILLLTELEGKHSRMYRDSAGLPTIGIGHLITDNEPHLLTATLTDTQVNALLRQDIARFENAVNSGVKVPINQSQFDALVILAFNIGTGAFAGSTVLKRINARDTEANIREAWGRWKMAGGRVVQGLINRRNREMELYFTGEQQADTRKMIVAMALLVVGAGVALYVFN
jgi:lysozyme